MKPDDAIVEMHNDLRERFIYAAAAVVILQLADIITTFAFLRVGGVEANPLMAPFVGRGLVTVALLLVIKFGIARGLVNRWSKQGLVRAVPKVYALVGFYGVTVLSNLLVFAQLVGR